MENNQDHSQQEQEKLVAEWLLSTPGFFERNPSLLANLSLTNSHQGKVVSLQEKQMAILRNQNRDLNAKLAQMLRFGTENDRTQSLMVAWLEELLLANSVDAAIEKITHGLDRLFEIGQVTILDVDAMSDGLKKLVEVEPVCGDINIAKDFLPEELLIPDGSIAIIPLLHDQMLLGALLLISKDKNKFVPAMGVTYIQQFGRLASAALYRFRQGE
jgi:uncharacterized protein YigA (DUF484 family)